MNISYGLKSHLLLLSHCQTLSDRRVKIYRTSVIFLYLIPLMAIWFFEYLPFQDYPRHLAGIKVLRGYYNSDILMEHFSINFFKGISPIPNIAFELFAAKICYFCSINTAGKLFISCYVLLFIFSTYLLSRELNIEFADALLMILPLVYSTYFYMSFLNFIFSMPLYLISIWAYFCAKREERYLILLGIVLIPLYISHLFAFASFLLFLFLDLVLSFRRVSRRFILFIFFSISIPLIFSINYLLSGTGNAGYYHPDGIWYKNIMFAFPFLYFSLNSGIIMFVSYVFALLSIFYGFKVINGVFVVAAASYLLIYLALPFSSIEGTFVDVRALAFSMLMLPFSVRLEGNRYKYAAFAVILLISFLNSSAAWSSFSKFNREVSPGLECLKRVEDRSKLLYIVKGKNSPSGQYFLGEPYAHAWGYAFLYKDFMTPDFSSKGHHVVKYRKEPYIPPDGWYSSPGDGVESEIKRHYTYIAIVGIDESINNTMGHIGTKVCESGIISLYTLNK